MSRGIKSDWAEVWRESDEARVVESEITALSHPTNSNEIEPSNLGNRDKSTDSASLLYQYKLVQGRAFRWYFRSPVYIRSKVVLNCVAGLFLGFTYYKQRNSAQGLQNKMFASFAPLILSARMQLLRTPSFGDVC